MQATLGAPPLPDAAKRRAPTTTTTRRAPSRAAVDGGAGRARALRLCAQGAHETLLLDLHDRLVPYEAAWAWQKGHVDRMCASKIAAAEIAAAAAAEAGGAPAAAAASPSPAPFCTPPSPCRDALVLLQHRGVYTLGAGATRDHLRFDPSAPPLPLHRVERGGEVTWHGPGQLVLYPLLDLGRVGGGQEEEESKGGSGARQEGRAGGAAAREGGGGRAAAGGGGGGGGGAAPWPARSRDLHWYLRSLEEVVVRALWRASRLRGERAEGLTGVWVGGAKVAAVGVRARSWVTYHGVALNVGADLSPFGRIVPCGIPDKPVGSVRAALGLPPPPALSSAAAFEAAAAAAGGSEASAAELAALRDPLVTEYRDALLDAFGEVFDARLARAATAAAGEGDDKAAAAAFFGAVAAGAAAGGAGSGGVLLPVGGGGGGGQYEQQQARAAKRGQAAAAA